MTEKETHPNKAADMRKEAEEELKKSQEHLKDAHRLAHIGIWEWFAETDTVTWSEELYRIAGIEPMLPAPTYSEQSNIYAPESWDRLKVAVEKTLETGASYQLELELIRPDGTTRSVNAFGGATYDNNGHITGLHGTIQDITARKQAEDALRESETLFRKLFEDHSAVKLIIDPNTGSLIDANEAASRYYGWPRERLKEMNITEINTLSATEIKNEMEMARAKSRTYFEFRHRLADGAIRDVAVFSSSFENKGKVLLHSIIQDITERKRFEEVQAFLAKTSSGTLEEPFFEALARYLAQNLGMDYVCIDRLEGDELTARTVAVWCDGHFEDNVTYALKDTPCGDVVGQTVCCFPTGVCQLFPRDPALQDLKAESYVGVTLFDHTGRPIGLIAVIGRKPLANRPLVEAILKMVAARAAGEVERLVAEEALRESEGKYRNIFQNAAIGIFQSLPEGRFLRVNPELAQMMGYVSPEEMISAITDISAQTCVDSKKRSDIIAAAMENSGWVLAENRYRRKDGTIMIADLTLRKVLHPDGTVAYFEGFVTDITRRKQAEEALEEERRQLQQALNEVRTLRGIVPICSYCKKIRDDEGYWNHVEKYVSAHTDAKFSHGICPACFEREMKGIKEET